jgi:hypothetical protein
MTERLDRIEANMADLITMSGNLLQAAQVNSEAIEVLKVRAAESDNRFNILIGEMRADRAAMEAALRNKSSETETLFNILIAEMRADRQAFQLQFAQVNTRVDDLEANP